MTHYRAARLLRSHLGTSLALTRRFEQVAWIIGAAAVTAVAAQVSLTVPGLPVPFTCQPVAVMLAGVVLGARGGAASQALYLALGASGLSAFAWSPVLLPGIARVVGPTGGFLLAFPLAAYVAGALAARHSRGLLTTAMAMFAGTAVLHVVGWAWALAAMPHGGARSAVAIFLAADLVKMCLAAPLAARLVDWRRR